MVKSMVMVNSSGLTVQNTLESLMTTTFTEQAFMNGLMEDAMRALGLITRCTEKVFSPGKTVENTEESMLMTKSKGRVHFLGQMVENT